MFDPKHAVEADQIDGNDNRILEPIETDGVVGRVILAAENSSDNPNFDGTPNGSRHGMGGQGVLAIPNLYDGWIEATVASEILSSEMQDWID